jgi:hypothetical protein
MWLSKLWIVSGTIRTILFLSRPSPRPSPNRVGTIEISLTRYLGVDTAFGMPGQPAAHYYFHRPLHRLLGPFLATGLTPDGLDEPRFDESVVSSRQTSWSGALHEIPLVLAVRLRPR